MKARLAAALLLAAGALPAAETWERLCRPVPADPARPGLLACPALSSGGPRVLVRPESDSLGLRRAEWSAEEGLTAVHVPDARFWEILDAFSGNGGEWIERDPATLGADTLLFGVRLGQAFECRDCPQPWLAGTWGPFGASRLVTVRRAAVPAAAAPRALALVPGADASPLALPLVSSRPCKGAAGTCVEERTGPGGTRWHLERPSPREGWALVRVEWTGTPLGDSLPLEDLREDLPPAELRLLLSNWLGAEADLFAANVLDPAAPLFEASAGDWRRRALPGFRLGRILSELERSPRLPDTLELYRDGKACARIEGRTRRLEVRR